MRIKKEILETTAVHYVGEETIPIINYLKGKEDISEFTVADDTKIEIHLVRNILYRLNGHNLAKYIRKKDRIKGWYISYWSLNIKRFVELYDKYQEEKVSKLKDKLKKEQDSIDGLFICPNLCSRVSFDRAMELEFKCTECGRLLNQQNNTRTIEHLKEMIEALEVAV
ncbi:MAG: hypothetical protein KKF44_05555 [Nanoarchaeota archaeon]|nr:hypothetical protein [Nanoarchaeota archaeon]